MARSLAQLNPHWMKDKQTGTKLGFFFTCPSCDPEFIGLLAHPIMVYVDEEYARAFSARRYHAAGGSWETLSVLGLIEGASCKFRGWIRKGEVLWIPPSA